jgi:hypothetical protein
VKPSATGAITANLCGGLGNQLFIVAGLLATARRNGLRPYLHRPALSDSCEEPRPTYWGSMLSQLDVPESAPADAAATPMTIVPEPARGSFAPITGLNPLAHHKMVGFFQSDVFFDDAANDVRQLFTPPEALSAASERLRQIAPRPESHVIGLHVRRGDYLRMTDVFEILPHRYYLDALELLCGRQLATFHGHDRAATAPFTVLVFCEEQAYGRTLAGVIEAKYPAVRAVMVGCPQSDPSHNMSEFFASPEVGVPSDVQELLLLATCNDVVIANSSFSWWSAYLNQNPMRRVVAPAKWFVQEPFPAASRLYCDGWIVR